MLDKVFAAAYIDNDVNHRIFGRKLKPFCLWHLLLLQTIDSPFVVGGDVTLRDLKTAIGICSLKYRHSKVKRPRFPLFLSRKNLKIVVEHFTRYVEDYLSRPEYTVVPFDLKAPQYTGLPVTPPPSVVVTAFNAVHGARIPINKAWNIPIGEAYIAEAMYLRFQGERLDFMDDDAREFQEELKKAGVK